MRTARITLLKRSSLRMSILACREPSWDYYGVFGYRWGPEAPLVRFPNSYSWNVTIRHHTLPCFAFLLGALTECNEKHNVDFKIYASISQHIISILNGWLPHTWHIWYLPHKIVKLHLTNCTKYNLYCKFTMFASGTSDSAWNSVFGALSPRSCTHIDGGTPRTLPFCKIYGVVQHC